MNQTSWKFYLRPAEAWQAMLDDLRSAKTSIDLEQYIFLDDEAGRPFFDILAEKANRGVKVRLLLDGAGSYSVYKTPLVERLSESGVKVEFFNPIKAWQVHNISSWFLRDHRKILIVDGETGYAGGVGIRSDMRSWRDTHIRITGPAVGELRYAYDRMWEEVRQRKKFISFRRPPRDASPFHFLTNSPGLGQRFIYASLLRAIRGAKKHVYLTTPYFVPSLRLFTTLIRAATRGLKVYLLLPLRSDVRAVDLASRSYFSLALRSGVKIFLYRNQILHVKTAAIDDTWASVGSTNLDSLSLLFNYEGDLVGSERAFVQELNAHFHEDLQSSRELLHAEWIRRPLRQKFLEAFAWLIHQFL